MIRKYLSVAIWAVIFIICFTSCGGDAKEEITDQTETPSPSPTLAVSPSPTPTPSPTPSPVLNPLTALPCSEEADQARRPVAIMINNRKIATPHPGIGEADIIYEVLAEGDITRLLAIFFDPSKVGDIGSVRSARTYYVDLAQGHDALYLHFGGSPQAYSYIRSNGFLALDGIYGGYEGSLYVRDPERRKKMGLEHSVVTSGERIEKAIEGLAKLRLEVKSGAYPAFSFSESARTLGGDAVTRAEVKYSSTYKSAFVYKASSQTYVKSQFGEAHIDGNTGESLEFTNVFILKTDI